MLEHLVPCVVAIPLLVAAMLLPLSGKLPQWVATVAAAACSLFVTAVAFDLALATQHGAITYWFGGWTPQHGITLGIGFNVDPIGAGLAAFAALLVTLAFVFAAKYFKPAGTLFHVLMLVFLAAMCGFALTGDIFNLFVFFELMSVAAFALTAYKVEEESAIAGAINFAITNSIGAFLVLIGIALLYGRTGALNMAQIAASVASQPPDGLLTVALLLLVTGFFVKGAVAPFHFWLDDAHAVAPTPLCVLFSGVMVQLSMYAVARIYWTIFAVPFHDHHVAIRALFIAVGAVTAIAGGLMAFSQRHIKRLLAFSTISHSGLFVCGLSTFSALGIAAVALFIVAHGLIKAALFMGSGMVLHRRGSVDETELHGRCLQMLPAAAVFIAGGLALAGLPPFGLALAKTLLERAVTEAGSGWLILIFALASALDGAAVLRVAGSIFFGIGRLHETGHGVSPKREERETDEGTSHTPWTMLAPAGIALALCLAAGLLPHFVEAIAHSALGFTHAHVPLDLETSSPADIMKNAATAIAAVAIAVFGWFVPSYAKRLDWLRAIHDGVFTDYTLWLLAGVAVYGVIFMRAAF